MIYLYKKNETFFEVDCEYSIAKELKDFLSATIKNAKWDPKVRNNLWDGKISFLNLDDHTFPIGLLPQFLQFCDHFQYEYKFEFDIESLRNDITRKDIESVYDQLFQDSKKFEKRDYQLESIYRAIKNKRGVIESSVGSGKSIVISVIIRILLAVDKNILLVVPRQSLVLQMYDDFKDYGWENIDDYCSILFSGKELDEDKPLLIATWQSLQNKPEYLFKRFECIIVDECHGESALVLQEISKYCVRAEYRLGFTGTLPKERIDQLGIFGYLGPKIFEIKSAELIERDILSNIAIACLILKHPIENIENVKKMEYKEEIKYLNELITRNYIFNWIFDNIPDGQNTLILFDRVEHLHSVYDYLKRKLDKKYKIVKYYGEVNADEREKIRKNVEISKNGIILATFGSIQVGINMPKLHNIISAASSRSYVRVIQYIGRGLRKHLEKDKLILWDIVDDLSYMHTLTKGPRKGMKVLKHNYVYSQYLERLNFYDEQKFKHYTKILKLENILILPY